LPSGTSWQEPVAFNKLPSLAGGERGYPRTHSPCPPEGPPGGLERSPEWGWAAEEGINQPRNNECPAEAVPGPCRLPRLCLS